MSAPRSTGLALFDEIEIKENDTPEEMEQKQQRIDLRDQKAKLIAERKENSKQEMKAYEELKKGQESEEDKKSRIQRGLQSLNLAPNTSNEQD